MKDLTYYLKTYKRWWLTPIIVVVILFVLLLSLAQFAPVLTPFIYTLF